MAPTRQRGILPQWVHAGERPELPRSLPGELALSLRPGSVEVIHAAPRAGATTLLLRTVLDAERGGMPGVFIPAEASATWGTGPLLSELRDVGEVPHLVAIDDPAGPDWVGHLKAIIDANKTMASASIVIAVPGVKDAKLIAGTLAGRRGGGGRHLLMPRRFADVLEVRHPKTLARLQTVAMKAKDDLGAFARAVQPVGSKVEEAWHLYLQHGALPSALSSEPKQIDAETAWTAAHAVAPPSANSVTDVASALRSIAGNPAITLTELASRAGRSTSWTGLLDNRAEDAMVSCSVHQGEKPRGPARRVLVDPAYADPGRDKMDDQRANWAGLVRAVWRESTDDDPDKVRRHGVEWRRQATRELLITDGWVLDYIGSEHPNDRRRLRPLRTVAGTDRRPLRITDGPIDLTEEPYALPVWTACLAAQLGVISWGG